MQSDPIVLGSGLNTYGYALQNPLRLVDPKGLVVQAVPIAIGACAANPACSAAVATALRVAAGYAIRAALGAGLLAVVDAVDNDGEIVVDHTKPLPPQLPG